MPFIVIFMVIFIVAFTLIPPLLSSRCVRNAGVIDGKCMIDAGGGGAS
jgi:hypothetical protein